MSKNKLHLTITGDGSLYKVEMRDHYCNYTCVYEPSVESAMSYAAVWFADAEKRYKQNQIHAKAVHVMAHQDKYDSLD